MSFSNPFEEKKIIPSSHGAVPVEKKSEETRETRPRERPSKPSERKEEFRDLIEDKKQKEGKIEEEYIPEKESASPFDLVAVGDKKEVKPVAPSTTPIEPVENMVVENIPLKEKVLDTNFPDIAKSIIPKEVKPEINPLAAQVPIQREAPVIAPATVDPQVHRTQLLQLAKSLIDNIQEIIKPESKELSFTIKHPPLFDGVTVNITQMKQGTEKEFNLTFMNLTNPEARALIESKANESALRQHLVEKGYVLHQVTIEPKLAPSIQTETKGFEQRDQSQERDFSEEDHKKER